MSLYGEEEGRGQAGLCMGTSLPEQTDTTESIIFPQLPWPAVKKMAQKVAA